jgi:DNA mismatch endonuclease (patch repair protein)
METQRQRDTKVELALRRELHARGLRYRIHRRVIPGLRREADILFPRARVAIFVDGCFWHGCPKHGTWPRENAAWWREKIERNVSRDRHTDDTLESAGWRSIRVWEHEPAASAADEIEAEVRRRLGPRRSTRSRE